MLTYPVKVEPDTNDSLLLANEMIAQAVRRSMTHAMA